MFVEAKQRRQPEFEFFSSGLNPKNFYKKFNFQVVIDFIVDAEQNCRKSNNDN